MSMMSYTELCALVRDGVITGLDSHDQINASSIDVRLGNEIIVEVGNENQSSIVDPVKRTNFGQRRMELGDAGYLLQPGEFVLAHTIEVFNLPDYISAEFRLKSSGARSGLNNLFACHCDPGWHDSTLTLELHNVLRLHQIKLTAGMRIGQMLFHRHAVHVPEDRSYAQRGRYNGDDSVSSVKE